MYQHKAGYALGEPYATHARRRYRLLPPREAMPHGPIPDPNLWIVHYAPADDRDRIPVSAIPIDPRTQQTVSTRQYLQSQGHIVQKDFMLHDRASWPQIPFPMGQGRAPGFPGGVPPGRAQGIPYPPQAIHAASVGPPAKRARTAAHPSQSAVGPVPLPDATLDDEEDTSRGDYFDHITPREISAFRYKQNHEWMEEILSSPYPMSKIVPVDLGLGLKGMLTHLTEGIFETVPGDPSQDKSKGAYVGKLPGDKAQTFRDRMSKFEADHDAEIARMKAKHAKRMAKFQKSSIFVEAERELRSAVHDPSDIGPEFWRLEGKIDDSENAIELPTAARPTKRVDDIVARVEAQVGRRVVAVQELKRIQDGGLQERQPTPPQAELSRNGSQNSGVLIGDADIDMGNSAAGLLDQLHSEFGSGSTPGNAAPTQQTHLQAAGTPGHGAAPSPQPQMHASGQHTPQPPAHTQQGHHPAPQATSTDVEMGGTVEGAADQSRDDWVVVPPGGVSPPSGSGQSQPQPSHQPSHQPQPSAPAQAHPAPSTSQSAHTEQQQHQQQEAHNPHEFSADPNDFGDFNTAGDALASFGSVGDDHGDLGMDLDLGMDDSAFGEAFQGMEQHRIDGGHEM